VLFKASLYIHSLFQMPLIRVSDCLQKSNYKEERCQKQVRGPLGVFRGAFCLYMIQVDALYECCNAFYKKNGDNASTVSCPKASLLQ
jgi:hypothetical protein